VKKGQEPGRRGFSGFTRRPPPNPVA